MSRLVGMYVGRASASNTDTHICPDHCILRILLVSLQGLGPELRGQRVGAAGNEAPQAVPKTRTWKRPAASAQPGRFRDLGLGMEGRVLANPLDPADIKPPML